MRPQLRPTRGSSWNRSVTQLWQLRTREDNQPSPNICSNTLLPTTTFPPKNTQSWHFVCMNLLLRSIHTYFQKCPSNLGFANNLGFCSLQISFKNNQPVDEQSLRDLQLVTKTQFLQSNSRKISKHTNSAFGNSKTGWQPKEKHTHLLRNIIANFCCGMHLTCKNIPVKPDRIDFED